MFRITSPDGRSIPIYQPGDRVPYRLPDGRIVRIDYWACRQAFEVPFQTRGGHVTAVRADEHA